MEKLRSSKPTLGVRFSLLLLFMHSRLISKISKNNKKLFVSSLIRRQLNHSRLRFWAGIAHWTTTPIKLKYYQLKFTLNRLPWAPVFVIQRVFFSKTTGLYSLVFRRRLFLHCFALLCSCRSFYYLCALRTLRSLFGQLKNVYLFSSIINPISSQVINQTLAVKNYWPLDPIHPIMTYTTTNTTSNDYFGTTFNLNLFITKVFFRFYGNIVPGFQFIASVRKLQRRFYYTYKIKLRLKYIRFLHCGSARRVSFFMRNRRKLSSRRLPLHSYDFCKLIVHINNQRIVKEKKPVYCMLSRTPFWWRYAILRGLRAPFRLGFYIFRSLSRSVVWHFAPIFFLFFTSLRIRVRYNLTGSTPNLPLIWKLLLAQKDFLAGRAKSVNRTVRPLPVQCNYLRVRYSSGFTTYPLKQSVVALSRGSLLPSPFVSGFKRNWFVTYSFFAKASKRLFRFCLPWRAKLSFLNKRRRWIWVRRRQYWFDPTDTGLFVLGGMRNLRLFRTRRRPFLRKRFIQLRLHWNRLSYPYQVSGYTGSPSLVTRSDTLNLTYCKMRTLCAERIFCREGNLYFNLRPFLSTTLRVFSFFRDVVSKTFDTINNLTVVPKAALRNWRLLISGEVDWDHRRRKFIPLRGSYVSTYFSAYINRFFEYFLGTRVGTIVNFELLARVSPVDFFFLEMVKSRLFAMNSAFSTIFFINEFIDLLFMALRLRNFNHLIAYINRLLKSLVLWDHKRFFVFFFSAFREQFLPFFPELGITGLQIIIRGKIGVGGNSRKRSMALRLGVTSRTHTFINTYTLNTWLNTTTGALGLRIFLYGVTNN